jgi:transcriptional regulator with XRE-family HTH domain
MKASFRPTTKNRCMGTTIWCATAERMGTDAPALSRLETGKMPDPTLAMLHKCAEALGRKLEMELAVGLE